MMPLHDSVSGGADRGDPPASRPGAGGELSPFQRQSMMPWEAFERGDGMDRSASSVHGASGSARDLHPIELPKPGMEGFNSVLAALRERKTTRDISSRKLPTELLSSLLWAAFGVNRETAAFGRPGRTAPSASNSQEIELYVAMLEGVFLYEAIPHRLTPVAVGDLRRLAVRNGSPEAPIHILYIADPSRFDLGSSQPDPFMGDPEIQKSYYYADAGFIAQNVNLFAASEGLAAWFHNCDRAGLARELRLCPEQLVLFAQSVGYPAWSAGRGPESEN
jgi:hypothetical protein